MSAATPREALVVLAHGSRDPRSAATIRLLVEQVRALRPGLRVEAAFLELSEPALDDLVDRLVGAGVRGVVVVPLLLTEAYHARVDLPAAVDGVASSRPGLHIRRAEVLGTDDVLLDVLDDRVAAAAGWTGPRVGDALVVAAAGSSDARANGQVAALAHRWGLRHGLPARAAFASSTRPDPAEAVRDLRGAGHRRVAVGQLFLAPGLLADRAAQRAREAGAVAVAEPLGADPVVAALVLERFDAVVEEVPA